MTYVQIELLRKALNHYENGLKMFAGYSDGRAYDIHAMNEFFDMRVELSNLIGEDVTE